MAVRRRLVGGQFWGSGVLAKGALVGGRLFEITYNPVMAAGTPTVSARLVGFGPETLSSPLPSLRNNVMSVFGVMMI